VDSFLDVYKNNMKIFWTKKQYNQFKDLLVKRSYDAGKKVGLKTGQELGVVIGMKVIRENYILKEKKDDEKKRIKK